MTFQLTSGQPGDEGRCAGQIPPIYRDKEGMNYVKTKAGNFAMVNYDSSGRMYMIDEAGTLYYDTGEPSMGIYIVSPLLPPSCNPLQETGNRSPGLSSLLPA